MPTRQIIQKRTEREQEILTRNQKLHRQEKCIRLQQILQAWRQSAHYTEKHAAEIQYARRPNIDIINTQKLDRRKKQARWQKNRPRSRITEYADWVKGRPFRQTPIQITNDGRGEVPIRNYICMGKGRNGDRAKIRPRRNNK